ncbi:transporter substrate-binding domain-containing protein [Sulfurimonas sp.]|uniref:transporter substrate-binding domain-containing protein n=1 Tax=Sulfurimonas sp. TaxID=2022749 RepID=UPI003D14C7E1
MKLFFRFVFLFFLFMSTLFGALSFTNEEKVYIKNHPKIILGSDYNWPPFDFVDKQGKHTGLSEDFIRLVEKKSGLKIEIKTGVWSQILEEMKYKQLDGLVCAVKTQEREQYLNFSEPYVNVPMIIITQRGKKISSMEDLVGKTVSINRSSYIHEWLKTKYPKLTLLPSSSNEESLEWVSLGKADAYVGNLAVGTYIINKNLLSNLHIAAKLPDFSTAVSIAIDKDKTTLYNIIQKSFADITFNETQAIKAKWSKNFDFGNDNERINLTQKEKKWIRQHQTIHYVIDNHWEPVEYLSKETNKHSGMTSDYLKLIEKKTGLHLVRESTTTWGESVEKINTRQADMYSCVMETPSRKKKVNFSKPYIVMPQVFVTRKETPYITDIHELYGKKVVLIKGYAISEIVQKEHPQIKVILVEDIIEALKKVIQGEAYAYMDLLPVVSNYIQKQGYANLKVSGISTYNLQMRMALRNDWDKTGIDILNKAINAISEEQRNQIYNKWVKVKYEKRIDYTIVVEIAAVFLLLIAASLFWNRKLSLEIAKRKSAEKKLKEVNKKLIEATNIAESASKAKSNFLSNMSHEIRTPMNSILGFAELLDEKVEDKKLKSFIKTIRSSGENLLILINDILDLSKIESGKVEIIHQKTNLRKILKESVALFSLQVEQKGLTLELQVDEKIPEAIISDAIRLKQILINLLGNALKFTDEGFIKVIAKVQKTDEHLSQVDIVIDVIDSGIGIAKESQEKIFNVFEQQENQDIKKYGGTGLGLAICKKLAILMDGSLEVQSKVGKGSVFTLTLRGLPIASLHDVLQEEDVEINSIEFEGATILVVDDIEQNRLLIKESFDGTTVKVIEAVDGEDAVAKVKETSFDLILMDIRMPKLDGYSATRIIKEDFDIPIIALTASVMQKDLQKFKKQRFDGYLRKPVSRTQLYSELKKFLPYKKIQTAIIEEKVEVENIEDLKLFLDALEVKVMSEYKTAQTSNDIGLISQFAQHLEEIALQHKIEYMQKYSQHLLDKIETFDIQEISLMLKEFKKIVKELSTMIEKQ